MKDIIPIIIVTGIICFFSRACKWLDIFCSCYESIRSSKKFIISEKNHTTYIRDRNIAMWKLGWIILVWLLPIFMIIWLIFPGYKNETLFFYLFILFIHILSTISTIETPMILYYGSPIAIFILLLNFKEVQSIKGILMMIGLSLVSYIILWIELPLPTIRRIVSCSKIVDRMLLIIGPLITLILHISNKDVIEPINKMLINSDPRIIDIWAKYAIIFPVIYNITGLTFSVAVERGESKAKRIYEKIMRQEHTVYSDLQDCILYGGEKYQSEIFCCKKYFDIIRNEEKSTLLQSER